MLINELSMKTETELEKMIPELKAKLRDLRFRVARRELKNVRDIREAKKDIAKIQTILHQKAASSAGKKIR